MLYVIRRLILIFNLCVARYFLTGPRGKVIVREGGILHIKNLKTEKTCLTGIIGPSLCVIETLKWYLLIPSISGWSLVAKQ